MREEGRRETDLHCGPAKSRLRHKKSRNLVPISQMRPKRRDIGTEEGGNLFEACIVNRRVEKKPGISPEIVSEKSSC